jgi:hypothetical protein
MAADPHIYVMALLPWIPYSWKIVLSPFDPGQYVGIERIPIAEVPEGEVEACIVAMSKGPAWAERGMSPLRFGDIIAIGDSGHMLIPIDDIPAVNMSTIMGQFPIYCLEAWAGMGIVVKQVAVKKVNPWKS